MKKIYFILLAVLCSSLSYAQTFQVGKRTITIVDEQRSNRSISTDVYYPSTTSGNNTAIADGTEKFPVVVFGHGFVIGTGSYSWLADSLASHGYIVALPNTEGSILPNHVAFGKDVSVVCSKIIAFDTDPASPFFGRVLNKGAVGGHSMGGGASFLAAASGNTDIHALFNFSAAETNPSAISAAVSVNVPSIIFSGSKDCIVPASTQLAMFNNIPSANCKAYVNLTDVLHCQFADNNSTCSLGQVFSGCNSSPLKPAQVFEKTISLLLPFLDYHLKNICSQGEIFQVNFDNLSATSKLLTCQPFPSCGPLPVKLSAFNGYFDGKVNVLKWKTDLEVNFKTFELQRSNDAQHFTAIASIAASGGNTFGKDYTATDDFPSSGINLYRLKLINSDNTFEYSEIINIRTGLKKLSATGIYPNPVRNKLQVKLNAESNLKAKVEIVNFSGQKVYEKSLEIKEGSSSLDIDSSPFAGGIYMLLLKSQSGEIFGTYKFVKR